MMVMVNIERLAMLVNMALAASGYANYQFTRCYSGHTLQELRNSGFRIPLGFEYLERQGEESQTQAQIEQG